jgi:ubiquinol-cytochrome c reductase cytochrome b subunit
MLVLAMVNGYVGYSLPDDLLSATGLRIANAVLLSIPVVGTWLAFFVFGSEFPGDQVIARLYPVHVLLVPALLALLITAHMVILIRQKHSQFPGPGRRETNVVGSTMWPTYAFRSLSLLCGVTAVCLLLGGLAQINPIWLWGPFEPGDVLAPAQPDWYVGWLDGALRAYPAWDIVVGGYRVPGLFVPTVVFPTVLFIIMYAWPWIDKITNRDDEFHQILARPRQSPFRVAVGVYAVSLFVVLLMTSGSDILARYAHLPVASVLRVLRVVILLAPVIMAVVAWFITRSLRDGEADHLAEVPVRDVTAAVPLLRRVPPPPVEAGAGGRPQPVEARQTVPSADAPEGWEAR